MVPTTLGIWLLAQVVLGRAETPPMPNAAAIGAWGTRAFSSRQDSEVREHFPEYENLVLAALAPGHALNAEVVALYREHAASPAPLAAMLHGWATGKVDAPSPRDGIRTWGPPAVVDSLVARDRETAAAWLAELGVEPGPVPAEAAPETLVRPSFAADPCGAAAPPAAEGTGTLTGVVRSVDGVLVPSAGVLLPATMAVTMTDAAGRFELCGVPAGPQEMRATHISHRDVAGSVAIVPGQVTQVEILMYAPRD